MDPRWRSCSCCCAKGQPSLLESSCSRPCPSGAEWVWGGAEDDTVCWSMCSPEAYEKPRSKNGCEGLGLDSTSRHRGHRPAIFGRERVVSAPFGAWGGELGRRQCACLGSDRRAGLPDLGSDHLQCSAVQRLRSSHGSSLCPALFAAERRARIQCWWDADVLLSRGGRGRGWDARGGAPSVAWMGRLEAGLPLLSFHNPEKTAGCGELGERRLTLGAGGSSPACAAASAGCMGPAHGGSGRSGFVGEARERFGDRGLRGRVGVAERAARALVW